MIIMDTVAYMLTFNVLFDVDGKRFLLYSNAIKHYDEAFASEINALNLFVGWHTLITRS